MKSKLAEDREYEYMFYKTFKKLKNKELKTDHNWDYNAVPNCNKRVKKENAMCN